MRFLCRACGSCKPCLCCICVYVTDLDLFIFVFGYQVSERKTRNYFLRNWVMFQMFVYYFSYFHFKIVDMAFLIAIKKKFISHL